MKVIKNITALVLTTSLFLFSCGIRKDKSTAYNNNPRIKLLTLDNGEEVIVRKDYYDTYSFNSWNAYNLANIEIHRIEEADFEIAKNRYFNLNDDISKLDKRMPEWLKTEEVLEDIDDVKEEYSKLMKERNAPTKNVLQNWEEFTEKFDDLREELEETIEKYDA